MRDTCRRREALNCSYQVKVIRETEASHWAEYLALQLVSI